jgi:hypothetical protein
MYFTVIDHYADFPEHEPPELNECLICLEIYAPDNVKPIDLKTQQVYLKKCECGGWIHLRCLCEWHEISNSCPICRLYMKKSESIISIFSFKVTNFCGTCILLVFRVCFVFWIMFSLACSYHIYKSYFIFKNRNQNDDKCEEITE